MRITKLIFQFLNILLVGILLFYTTSFGSNVAQKEETENSKLKEMLNNTIDDSTKITREVPEYTKEEHARLNVIKTKLLKRAVMMTEFRKKEQQ